MKKILSKTTPILLVLLSIVTITGCQQTSTPTGSGIGVTPSIIAIPSDTPVPMAVIINGEGITASEYESEIIRFQNAQTALGNIFTLEEATQKVLNDLIDQVLLKQGAEASGFTVDDNLVQSRIDNLVEKLGGMEILQQWEQENGYSDESLRVALKRQIAAAWMRDQITSSVPTTAEQVHVQQILTYKMESAQNAWNQLNSGADFDNLASEFDPITKGELGWFPRNYLPDIQIEEAAFSLQPGEYSQIIETIAGFSILMVLERDANHILSPDALLTLQIHAIQKWLEEQKQSSTIVVTP